MSKEISWQVELEVKPDKLNQFRILTSKMVASAKTEPGVMIYKRFISKDGKIIYLYEHYRDSESALSHLGAFRRDYGTQFSSLVERKRFIVFGSPSEELKAILDTFGATYYEYLDGFSLL